MSISAAHINHLAKRHHAVMKQLDGLRDKFAKATKGFLSTLEIGAGAWAGGALEGRTGGASLGPLPLNLGIGAILLAGSHLKLAGEQNSEHLNNLGNGFIGSYLAATGYSFGKEWKETGKLMGGNASSEALRAP